MATTFKRILFGHRTDHTASSTSLFAASQVDSGRHHRQPKMGDRHHFSTSSNSTPAVDYSSELNRVQSFDNWPASAPITADQLLQAGFHYTGEQLAVACHQCGARYAQWQHGQCPVSLHARISPACPWVLATQVAPASNGEVTPTPPTTPASNQVRPQTPTRTNSSEDLEPQMSGPISWESDSAALRRHARLTVPEFRKAWPNMPAAAFNVAAKRLRTFADWPVPFIAASQLASAGFVYLRDGDRVQCVFCRGEVMAWEEGDVPAQEHQRHFPACIWVRGVSADVPLGSDAPTAPPARPQLGYDECGPAQQQQQHQLREVLTPASYRGAPVTLSAGYEQPPQQLSAEQLEDLNVVPHSQASYPKFATREARLKSYQSWPRDVPQSVQSLVEAGLFYVGSHDQVKCFQCGGGLQNWEAQDIPWEEHARWFPRCNFVNLHKGREFVEKSKQHRPPVLPTDKPETLPVQLVTTPTSAGQRVTESELDVLMNTDITQTVLSMGLERGIIREVLRRRMEQCGYQFTNAEMLANAVLEVGDQLTPKLESETTPSAGQSQQQVTPSREDHTVLNMATLEARSSATTLRLAPGSSSGDKPARTCEQELKLCKICMDEEINVVFLPCGHLVACTNCASAMTDCPLCRMPIKGTVRTYLP